MISNDTFIIDSLIYKCQLWGLFQILNILKPCQHHITSNFPFHLGVSKTYGLGAFFLEFNLTHSVEFWTWIKTLAFIINFSMSCTTHMQSSRRWGFYFQNTSKVLILLSISSANSWWAAVMSHLGCCKSLPTSFPAPVLPLCNRFSTEQVSWSNPYFLPHCPASWPGVLFSGRVRHKYDSGSLHLPLSLPEIFFPWLPKGFTPPLPPSIYPDVSIFSDQNDKNWRSLISPLCFSLSLALCTPMYTLYPLILFMV